MENLNRTYSGMLFPALISDSLWKISDWLFIFDASMYKIYLTKETIIIEILMLLKFITSAGAAYPTLLSNLCNLYRQWTVERQYFLTLKYAYRSVCTSMHSYRYKYAYRSVRNMCDGRLWSDGCGTTTRVRTATKGSNSTLEFLMGNTIKNGFRARTR